MAFARPPELWDPATYEEARQTATSMAVCPCGTPVSQTRAQHQYDSGIRIHCGHCDLWAAVPDF